ncbi:MAG: hypothetical protein ACI825_001891 [Planctomycetota bacterium]|jgi:hypothetical protein
MKRVTGIGGLFFKTTDPKATKDWYKKHLGFDTDDKGYTFWRKEKTVLNIPHNGAQSQMIPTIINRQTSDLCLTIE